MLPFLSIYEVPDVVTLISFLTADISDLFAAGTAN
jgi:hypothetical protein